MSKKKITTLEEALARISELEQYCTDLEAKVAEYESRKPAGRKKHNEKWMESYDSFAELYGAGDKIPVIVEKTGISRRTLYRYKAYYDSLKENTDK